MCLFRKCDEQIIETKEYPSVVDRMRQIMAAPTGTLSVCAADFWRKRVTTIKCNSCGRIRFDERDV